MLDYKFNKYQTVITETLLDSLHKEVRADLIDALENIKFIRWLTYSEDIRGFACNRPKEEDGRIVVDITKPHILENMDFFRERALYHDQYGCYTKLHPNPNPKSEYAEFWKEEVRRWKEGLVRPSDGEWIPGYYYFYLNYSPIWKNIEVKIQDKKVAKVQGERVRSFPDVYLGDYLWFHYMDQARRVGSHCKLLKARGVGFSFKFGAITPCSMYIKPGLSNFHLASDKTFLLGDKGVFGKVIDTLDWIGDNTPLPHLRLVDQPLEKQIGTKDDWGAKRGLKSSVSGISMKDNPDKARGIRGPIIQYEEDGVFPNLENAWNVNRSAVERGGVVFGLMIAGGTGGTEGADFAGSEKLFYYPKSYNIFGLPNVYDKNVNSENECGFFWGAYLNRERYYDKVTGESDVVGALIEIFKDRFQIKHNSSDPNAITQRKAEEPITPQEAIMRRDGTIFPVSDIKDYLSQIMPNFKSFTRTHYVGRLQITGNGTVEFVDDPTLTPIREYPLLDTLNREGAVEIFEKPQFMSDGKTEPFRYISGSDVVDDDDNVTTDSLPSIFIRDRFTKRIVAEYTGRPRTANEFFEVARRLLMYYGATCNYENNKKGMFAYFENHHSTHLLCDNPSILDEKGIANTKGNFGNKKKGTNASAAVNAWGRRLQADDMISPAYGHEEEGKLNLHTIRSIGYLKETAAWNPDGNFDRCVLSDTQLLTDTGTINISDIKIGDKIVTVDGNQNEVYETHKNIYTDKIFNIRSVGNHRALSCTNNHPLFTTKFILKHNGVKKPYNTYNMSNIIVKRADEVTKEDYLLIPTRNNKLDINMSKELKYILGWVLGDGYINNTTVRKEYCVKIYFQVDQLNICKNVKNTIELNFGEYFSSKNVKYNTKCIIAKEGNMYKLIIHSKPFHNFCTKYLGNSPNKKMSKELFNSCSMIPFLRGYFEADGHYEVSNKIKNRRILSVTSSNESEIYQIRQLLLEEDIWCTTSISKGYRLTNGYDRRDAYTISINNTGANKIIQGSLKFEPKGFFNNTYCGRFFKTGDGFWSKISTINCFDYNDYVYNISVLNNPSYIANGIASHNCSAMGMLMIYNEEVAKIEIRRVSERTKTIMQDPFFDKWYKGKKKPDKFML